MPAYIKEVEDARGDLIDILYYCSWHRNGILPWPAYDWPEYDVHCAECGDLVHAHAEDSE